MQMGDYNFVPFVYLYHRYVYIYVYNNILLLAHGYFHLCGQKILPKFREGCALYISPCMSKRMPQTHEISVALPKEKTKIDMQ